MLYKDQFNFLLTNNVFTEYYKIEQEDMVYMSMIKISTRGLFKCHVFKMLNCLKHSECIYSQHRGRFPYLVPFFDINRLKYSF